MAIVSTRKPGIINLLAILERASVKTVLEILWLCIESMSRSKGHIHTTLVLKAPKVLQIKTEKAVRRWNVLSSHCDQDHNGWSADERMTRSTDGETFSSVSGSTSKGLPSTKHGQVRWETSEAFTIVLYATRHKLRKWYWYVENYNITEAFEILHRSDLTTRAEYDRQIQNLKKWNGEQSLWAP